MKPDITKEDFIQSYRFLRIPLAYAGESFTKGHLLVYLVMKDLKDSTMRLYETTYTAPISAKFLKEATASLHVQGRDITVDNPNELANFLVSWDDPNKTVTTKLLKEFGSDFETIMEEILELQTEAIERGWQII